MFGAQIRAARLARGITETRLAREAGIQRSQVVDLEENRNVTIETLRRVLDQLPSITHLTLPTREPDWIDAAVVRGLIDNMQATMDQLRDMATKRHSSVRRRLTADEHVSPEEGTRIDELNEAIDENHPPLAKGM